MATQEEKEKALDEILAYFPDSDYLKKRVAVLREEDSVKALPAAVQINYSLPYSVGGAILPLTLAPNEAAIKRALMFVWNEATGYSKQPDQVALDVAFEHIESSWQ
jgi:hypothetical protein